MLIQLSRHLSDYVYDVFYLRFDGLAAFGVLAQFVFTARFLVQWLASERAGRSVVPVSFWALSMVGGMMTLTYGLLRRDPIIILGQAFALVIYARNLALIARQRARRRAQAAAPAP